MILVSFSYHSWLFPERTSRLRPIHHIRDFTTAERYGANKEVQYKICIVMSVLYSVLSKGIYYVLRDKMHNWLMSIVDLSERVDVS